VIGKEMILSAHYLHLRQQAKGGYQTSGAPQEIPVRTGVYLTPMVENVPSNRKRDPRSSAIWLSYQDCPFLEEIVSTAQVERDIEKIDKVANAGAHQVQ